MEGEGEEEIKGIKARVTIRPVVALATITSTKHVAYYYKNAHMLLHYLFYPNLKLD